MENYIITLDLGTTNVKIGLYSSELKEISMLSLKVQYLNSENYVEFNPEHYWKLCKEGIKKIINTSMINPKNIFLISLTGQAETLILLDSDGKPLRHAISWMDSRSTIECEFLKKYFGGKESYVITGLPELITTWPITKILWVKNNEKEIFNKTDKFLLLKDYIIFKFTGRFFCDYSIAGFSYYFNIQKKEYWKEILDFVGVKTEQLPELINPVAIIGTLKDDVIKDLNLSEDIQINVGILDHFAGMVGVGNIKNGLLSETTGTALALAVLVQKPDEHFFPIPCHCGPFNSYVLLPACESGGICLEWFKDNFYPRDSFKNIDLEVEKNLKPTMDKQLIFLPYIIGTNSPEFNQNAKGIFYGLKIQHKKIDLAISILEGLSYLLRKNIEFLEEKGIRVDRIISLGGGAKSKIWNQIKADIIHRNIYLPIYQEATSFGAAILGALVSKKIEKIYDAQQFIDKYIEFTTVTPNNAYRQYYNNGFYQFTEIYRNLEKLFNYTSNQ